MFIVLIFLGLQFSVIFISFLYV